MDAEQILRSAGRRSPGLVGLALLLSPAVRIEPEVMRAVRLELIPRLPAGAEGELWFSPLVLARGLDGIVLDAAVANLLRARARAILLPAAGAPGHGDPPTQEDIKRAWRLIEQMHAASPPTLRLEETVNWLAVSEANPESGIEAQLQLAVEALRRGRTGIARWAARALPRMPDTARGTTAAWLLAQGAGRRLASRDWETAPPDIGRIDDLAALLPARNDVPLGVRRLGDRLDLGEVGRDGVSIRVLDTDPRVLALSVPEGNEVGIQAGPGRLPFPEGTDEIILQVDRGSRFTLDFTPATFGADQMTFRTPRGELYRVDPIPDTVDELRRSCLRVDTSGTGTTIGIAVAPDLVLTVLPSPQEVRGDPVISAVPSGDPVSGELSAALGVLVLLRVTHLPADAPPLTLPSARPSPPEADARWYGVTLADNGTWLTVTGAVTSPGDRALTVTLDVPAENQPVSLVTGCPVVVDGVLTGLITSQTSEGSFNVDTAGLTDLLSTELAPGRLPGLTSAASAIALDFHMHLRGFRRAGRPELDTDAVMAGAGLTADQLGNVQEAAEFVIKSGIQARTQPRWLQPSGPDRFSAAVEAALGQAEEAWRSLEPGRQGSWLGTPRFSLTAAAQDALSEVGVTLVPSSSGGVRAEIAAGRFTARRLRAVLGAELPGFDDWNPWSPAPATGADRPQAVLEVIAAFCREQTRVPEPARTVLTQADDHLYPQWWQVRDGLVQRGIPDVRADQDFPAFLEAYLGWCLTLLHQVGRSAGNDRFDMTYAIPRSDAAALPIARFGLVQLPARSGTDMYLSGPFSSLVGFSAWVFLELAEQVRMAAAQPPPWRPADRSPSPDGASGSAVSA